MIYHWPFTACSGDSKNTMEQAIDSIDAKGEVMMIKLFTKSEEGLPEFIEYLKRYTKNIEVDIVDYNTEPQVDFEGNRLF